MNIKKLIFILVILIITQGCSNPIISNVNSSGKIDAKPIRVALFPNGALADVYIFNLKPDGELEVLYGNKKSRDMLKDDFMEYPPMVKKQKQLTKNEFKKLTKLANEISKKTITATKKDVLDRWKYEVFINDKSYNFNYHNEEESLDKFIDEIIELSPVEVELSGSA